MRCFSTAQVQVQPDENVRPHVRKRGRGNTGQEVEDGDRCTQARRWVTFPAELSRMRNAVTSAIGTWLIEYVRISPDNEGHRTHLGCKVMVR